MTDAREWATQRREMLKNLLHGCSIDLKVGEDDSVCFIISFPGEDEALMIEGDKDKLYETIRSIQ